MLNLKKTYLSLAFGLAMSFSTAACLPQACSRQIPPEVRAPTPAAPTEETGASSGAAMNLNDPEAVEAGEDDLGPQQRFIASHVESAAPAPSRQISEDPKWGTFEVQTVDYSEPAQSPIEMTVSVLCKDQVKMRKQRPAPTKEILLKNYRICDFKEAIYNKKALTLTIRYLLQSENPSPDGPTCDEIWERDYVFPEECGKWEHR